jgi:hypothetical protein
MADTEVQRLEAQLAQQQEKVDRITQQLSDAQRNNDTRRIASLQSELDIEVEISDTLKDRLSIENKIEKSIVSQLRSYTSLSPQVKKALSGDARRATALEAQLSIVGKLKAQQSIIVEAGGESDDVLDGRIDRMGDITSSIITQAKENVALQNKMKGVSDIEVERMELQNEYADFTKQITSQINEQNGTRLSQAQILAGFAGAEAKKKLEQLQTEEAAMQNLLNLKENQIKQGARLQEIQEQQESIMGALPGPIQESIGFAKKLGTAIKTGVGPLLIMGTLAVLALKSFTDLDDAAKEFRDTTGLTNSQMEGIKSDANEIVGQFGNLGIEAKNVFDTVAALKSEFSDTTAISKEVVAGLTVLSANFGVSAENAAKTQAILENVGGLSAETATSVGLQVANMAKLAGVAPAKVFEDMAGSAEIASTLFKGNIESFAKATIEARRLGTTIDKMGETAKGLLDFESGITEELTAAAMLGGDFNLTQARSLAYAGDLVGMQNEILNQVQKNGDFSKKDLFTQEQIAKATGMSVAEINKQLSIREKLNSLSGEEKKAAEDAMKAGLDLSNINKEDLATQIQVFSKQQEQQKVLDQISNQFTGIAATVGSVLVPLLETLLPIISYIALPVQAMAEGFKITANFLKENIALSSVLVGILGLVYAKAIGGAVARIWGAIVGTLGPFGIPVAIAATIGAISMAKSAMNVGDLNSPADGKTRISTKEGGLFELSPNDDVIAAPGLNDYLSTGLSDYTGKPVGEVVAQMGTSPSVDFTELLTEIRGLRSDLNSGKIAVYVDGRKVTSSVSRVVDKVSTNSYGL